MDMRFRTHVHTPVNHVFYYFLQYKSGSKTQISGSYKAKWMKFLKKNPGSRSACVSFPILKDLPTVTK